LTVSARTNPEFDKILEIVEPALSGSVFQCQDGGLFWDMLYHTPEGLEMLAAVGKSYGCVLCRDLNRQSITYFGLDENFEKALAALKTKRVTVQLRRDELHSIIEFTEKKLARESKARKIVLNAKTCRATIDGKSESVEFVKKWVRDSVNRMQALSLGDDEACPICLTPPDRTDDHVLACNHAYCSPCFKASLTTLDSFPITCQATGCVTPVPVAKVKDFLDATELKQVVQKADALHVRRNGDLYSFCPTPDCPQIFLVGEGSTQCDQCWASICRNCRTLDHEGTTCDEFNRHRAFRSTWANGDTQRLCPNSKCGVPIVKDGGCSKMVCQNCNTCFCWKCMKIFRPDVIYFHMNQEHGGLF
jgi:hypothetical protein